MSAHRPYKQGNLVHQTVCLTTINTTPQLPCEARHEPRTEAWGSTMKSPLCFILWSPVHWNTSQQRWRGCDTQNCSDQSLFSSTDHKATAAQLYQKSKQIKKSFPSQNTAINQLHFVSLCLRGYRKPALYLDDLFMFAGFRYKEPVKNGKELSERFLSLQPQQHSNTAHGNFLLHTAANF